METPNESTSNEHADSTPPVSSGVPHVSNGEEAPKTLARVGYMFTEGFKEAFARPKLIGGLLLAFIGIALGFVAAVFAGMFLFERLVGGFENTVGLIALVVFEIVIYTLMLVAYIAAGVALLRVVLVREQQVGYFDSIVWAIKHIWPIFLVGLYVQLVTTTGYVLLFIPGVILALYTMYSIFVFVTEDMHGFDALLRSIHVVRGRLWGVFWRTIVFALAVLLSVFIPLAILFIILWNTYSPIMFVVGPIIAVFAYGFVTVWMTFGIALLFESAQRIKPKSTFSSEAYPRLRKLLIAFAILGLPLMLLWNAWSLYDAFTDDPYDDYESSDVFLFE